MRSLGTLVLFLIVFALLAPAPWVQAAGEPQITTERTTLWAHNLDEGVAMSPDPDDPRSIGSSPSGSAPGAGTGTTQWEIPLDPALANTLILDPEGTITITVYIGSNTGAGHMDVETRLLYGDDVVAQGDAQSITWVPAGTPVTSYSDATWELTPQLDRLEPGKDLVWHVSGSGPRVASFMGMIPGHGHSNIELPVLAVEETTSLETRFSDHQEETFLLQGNETEPMVVLHTANWTLGPINATLTLETDITNGTLQLEVRDADDLTIANETQSDEGPQALNLTLEQTTPGNWTIILRLTDFVGEYSIQIAPVQETTPGEASDDDTTDTGDPGTGETNGNETATTVDDEQGFLPGPGVALFLVIVGAYLRSMRKNREN